MSAGVLLASVRVVHRKAHRSAAHARASREDAPLVVATVIAVQDDSARLVPGHDDDLILEQDRQPERIDVKRPRLRQVRDVQDQAVKVPGPHGAKLANGADAPWHGTGCDTP